MLNFQSLVLKALPAQNDCLLLKAFFSTTPICSKYYNKMCNNWYSKKKPKKKTEVYIKWGEGLKDHYNRGVSVFASGPEYSFLDGRIVPLTQGCRKRLAFQEKFIEKIVTLNSEIDFALERYEQMQKEEKERKENIIASKLKPKGEMLLKKASAKTV